MVCDNGIPVRMTEKESCFIGKVRRQLRHIAVNVLISNVLSAHSSMAFPHAPVIVVNLTYLETTYRDRLRDRYISTQRPLLVISSPLTRKWISYENKLRRRKTSSSLSILPFGMLKAPSTVEGHRAVSMSNGSLQQFCGELNPKSD